jgi:hypothetical protein
MKFPQRRKDAKEEQRTKDKGQECQVHEAQKHGLFFAPLRLCGRPETLN